MKYPDSLQLHGHFTLVTRDAETGQIHEERESDNLITTSGLGAVANAIGFALTANQNGGWGGAVAAGAGNLSNSFGALGTATTAATAADIALGHEIGRALVVAAGLIGSNIAEVDYFFGTAQGNGTIQEGGVFMNASYLPAALTSALNSGTTYTTLAVSPYLIVDALNNATSLPSGSYLLINYGSSGTVQYCQTTAQVNSGATSIPIAAVGGGAFVANATYPVGTLAVFGPNATGQPNPPVNGGVLFDHVIFGTPVTKTNSETATLGLQITITSV